MQITKQEIPCVARLVQQLCGIALDDSKAYLIEARLGKLAEAAACANFTEFCRKAAADAALRTAIIEAITTRETLFFRDSSPFDAIQYKVLPEIIDSKAGTPYAKRLRIWSAACSTGQEAYSIAMILSEMLPDVHRWDINILGTDISDAAVKQASLGRYAVHEIQRGMKNDLLQKYFHPEEKSWRVKDSLRCLVSFQRRDLLQPFGNLGPFDIIFCRNVAIYFDAPTRRSLFHRVAERLNPEGYLFAGSAESLADLGPQFMPQHHCRGIFYRPTCRPALAVA